jgi:hypothetical protein
MIPAGQMGFGTPAQSFPAAAQWGQASSVLGTAAPILSGIGQFSQASYSAQVAANNAKIQAQNSAQTNAAGNVAAQQQLMRTGEMIGQQKAAQGANGVDVNVGSTAGLRDSTQRVGDLDAALVQYNARMQARSQMMQSNADRAQSSLDRMSGDNALLSGLFKSGSSFLTSQSSLGAKASSLKYLTGGDGS